MYLVTILGARAFKSTAAKNFEWHVPTECLLLNFTVIVILHKRAARGARKLVPQLFKK